MSGHYEHLPQRRSIVDRRRLVADVAAAAEGAAPERRRQRIAAVLKLALDHGRAEIHRRILEHPGRGRELQAAQSFLADQILRVAFDSTTQYLYPRTNPSAAERITLVAVGGYGRGEMAPFSDIDLMFLSPMRHTPWVEQVVESVLYTLWDLGLKVGHSTRTPDDVIRMATADITVKTALLEARYLWGDQPLFDEAMARFRQEIVAGHARDYIVAKLAERDERHRRMGDSRYVVEPNIKDGKGGLRDLQALFWIGKFVHQVRDPRELVEKGLFTAAEYRQVQRALNHLWAVRINLHDLAGRAEERLTFDVQRELAERMRYASRPGAPAVERFMRHYFLTARQVGSLTALFFEHLEEQHARTAWIPRLTRRPRRLHGFAQSRGRIEAPGDDFFAADPVRLVELFQLASSHELGIQPLTMRLVTRDAHLIGRDVREDRRANALFLDVLTSRDDPESMLRLMNETGVLGHFLPDFGRVVAKMQWDMYHHYTVDEHSIRAVGLLARLEKGLMKADYPLSSAIVRQLASRRALYVAVLLHDVAKGRGGDHSILGEQVARALGPRLGLDAAETDTVAWLIRHHLLMSSTAFRRDLADPKTIQDFAAVVTSVERLRLLLVLTVVDICAVGPNVWNNWKAQLLTALYDAAEELLRLGHKQSGRQQRVAARQAELLKATAFSAADVQAYADRFADSYWLAEPLDVVASNMALVRAADAGSDAGAGAGGDTGGGDFSVHVEPDAAAGATLVTVYAKDLPGLFYRVAGGIALAGASIVDARGHTTKDGMALDNLLVQEPLGGPFAEPHALERLRESIRAAVMGEMDLAMRLAARPLPRRRQEAFPVVPQLILDNRASNRLTVVEVTAQDRPALLYALAYALFEAKLTIHSAHIATYGERAVDTFYLTDLAGNKIEDEAALKALEQRLLGVAAAPAAEHVEHA